MGVLNSCFQNSSESSDCPKYLALVTTSRIWPCKVYTVLIAFLAVVTRTTWHLEGLNSTSHWDSHNDSLSRSFCSTVPSSKVIRLQRSGINTIKYHTWPRIPMGKWQTHRRHHKREPRGQPFPSRWPQSTYKQTRTKHSQHKTEQKHKRSTKEVPPWNGQ